MLLKTISSIALLVFVGLAAVACSSTGNSAGPSMQNSAPTGGGY